MPKLIVLIILFCVATSSYGAVGGGSRAAWSGTLATLTTNTYLVQSGDTVISIPNSSASVTGRTNKLPSAAFNRGRMLVILDGGLTAFGTNLWIVADGTDTIAGGPTRTNLVADGGSITLMGNPAGNGWNIVSTWPPMALSKSPFSDGLRVITRTNATLDTHEVVLQTLPVAGYPGYHFEVDFSNSGTVNYDYVIRGSSSNIWFFDLDMIGDQNGLVIANSAHPGAEDTSGWTYSALYTATKSDINPATATAAQCAERINALIKALSRIGANEGHGLLRP